MADAARDARERIDAVLEALEASRPDLAGPAPVLTRLEGGWSRETWTLALGPEGDRRELVVRVKPEGAMLDTDLRQEYMTYELLGRHGLPVPAVHALVEDALNPFGGPWFVMDRVAGEAPNTWRRRDRERLEGDWRAGGTLGEDLVATLVAIHAIPAEEVAAVLPRRSFQAAVSHWHEIHDRMKLVSDPVVEDAYAWLTGRGAPPIQPRLVHGDYRIGNCIVAGGRLTSVLDWELAYFGDPRFDLGYTSLDYLAGKFTAPGSELLESVADRDWFMSRYEQLTGEPLDREVVRTYAVLGALMLIAVLSTGVRVYTEGQTRDVRMAWSRFAVPGLRQDVARLIGW